MDLHFNTEIVDGYNSECQKARILTEKWFVENMFCPHCGESNLKHFKNNKPVADFYCPTCNNQYELKSKNGLFKNKINDGAYDTMIERIMGNDNPDFFLLSYEKTESCVNNLIFVPKHFFTPQIIEKRNPLSITARRAGWTGCNILLSLIPEQGCISIIRNGVVIPKCEVIENVNKSSSLITNDINERGWLFDILLCVNSIQSDCFSAKDVYAFEKILSIKHPHNNNVKAKIRQQLQELRDRGLIVFLGNGNYKKI